MIQKNIVVRLLSGFEKGLRPLWIRLFLAAVSGLAAALAFPPFGLIFGLLGFAGLRSLMDLNVAQDKHSLDLRPHAQILREDFTAGFLMGLFMGLGYFWICLSWISEAFQVDAETYGRFGLPAVGILAAGLGLFWGLAGGVYRLIRPEGPGRIWVFAGLFSVAEWLRGHVLTGLPWDLVGEAWRAGTPVSQGAALIGPYGLTFLTLSFFSSFSLIPEKSFGRCRWVHVFVAFSLMAAIWSYGAYRLSQPPQQRPAPLASEALKIRLVQANIPQSLKWDPDRSQMVWNRYLEMTAEKPKGGSPPDVIVWPESAIPAVMDDYLAPNSRTRGDLIKALIPGQFLIFGAIREAVDMEGKIQDFNSLVVLQRTAEDLKILGYYDKHHLVPFGEYFPIPSLAETIGLTKLIHIGSGFQPGAQPQVFSFKGLPDFLPMICYESLFPHTIGDGGRKPGLIINVSNDAWYGLTTGPLQHFHLASYRAIEEGLPMIRVTPTGISGLINAKGQAVVFLSQGKQGIIDCFLPFSEASTPYHRAGEIIFWVVVSVTVVHAMILVYRRQLTGRS